MRVAIMDFGGEDISARDAKKVSDLIRTEIVNTGQYTVIERNEMGKILQEQGFSMTGCTEVSCAVQAGKLLSARKMLVGTVMKLDESLIINGRIIDVQRGTAEYAHKEIAQSRQDLVRAVDVFVARLTKRSVQGYARESGAPASTYGYAAIPFLVLGLGGAGAAIYANEKYKKNYNMYDYMRNLASLQMLSPAAIYASLYEISRHGSSRYYELESDKYKNVRLYTSIASGVTGGLALILGIVWLSKLSKEGKIGANDDISINHQFALTLPPQYYNDCFNFTKKNQYGFGLGINMRF